MPMPLVVVNSDSSLWEVKYLVLRVLGEIGSYSSLIFCRLSIGIDYLNAFFLSTEELEPVAAYRRDESLFISFYN